MVGQDRELVPALFVVAVRTVVFVTLLALSEIIHLWIDVEANTRASIVHRRTEHAAPR